MKVRQRAAKKLVLPLIALAMMTLTAYWQSTQRTHATPHAITRSAPAASAAARSAPDLRTR